MSGTEGGICNTDLSWLCIASMSAPVRNYFETYLVTEHEDLAALYTYIL
jgi:hypothetical protein